MVERSETTKAHRVSGAAEPVDFQANTKGWGALAPPAVDEDEADKDCPDVKEKREGHWTLLKSKSSGGSLSSASGRGKAL